MHAVDAASPLRLLPNPPSSPDLPPHPFLSVLPLLNSCTCKPPQLDFTGPEPVPGNTRPKFTPIK
jgi:hypothetical protein